MCTERVRAAASLARPALEYASDSLMFISWQNDSFHYVSPTLNHFEDKFSEGNMN
jgi:hypothetical protein